MSADKGALASHWAVVVTYRPDMAHLQRLRAVLDRQGAHVVVVDNASELPGAAVRALHEMPATHALSWLQNGVNLGIGAAQNRGIRHALAAGTTFITLLDQDSMPDDAMLPRLANAWHALAARQLPVFAVGPRLIDESSGRTLPFITYRYGVKRRVAARATQQAVECFSLLASGTTVHRQALSRVGLLDEGLFLEYVDVEWGARARARKMRCYGIPATTLQHNLGDARVHLAGRWSLPLHSPLRHYYTFRNAMLMQRNADLPLYWKLADLLRCLVTAPLFIALDKQPVLQARMILTGLRHGLQRRMGPYAGADTQRMRPLRDQQ